MNRLGYFTAALLVGSLGVGHTKAQTAPQVQFAGNSAIGGTLHVDVAGTSGHLVALLLSYERSTIPLNTRFGPIWLQPPASTVWVGWLSANNIRVSLPVPRDESLVGFKSFVQAISLQAGASPLSRFIIREPNVEPAVTKRVLVLNYDPIIESRGNRRLHSVINGNNPRQLTVRYADALRRFSGGFVDYEIVEWRDLDEFPLKSDGFRYDDASYLQAWSSGNFHSPDLADYDRILADHNLVARINSGDVDEVILWGAPGFGAFESRMVGPRAYWVNAPAMTHVPSNRLFVVMGFDYAQPYDLALHGYGHRIESILDHVYRPTAGSDWDLFNNFDTTTPGGAGVGTIHFPPNGRSNLDYNNPASVPSTSADWKNNWPNLTGATNPVNDLNWGSTHAGYMGWWMDHLPRRPGTRFGFQNNWWKYAADFNGYRESRR